MKVLDKENRVMVEPLSIRHFQDMEMCFPEWRLHLSEGHQYNGYGKFFFFFLLGVKICIPLFWRKVLQNRGFFSERTTISKLQEHFFFHSESKFASRCFEQRCSKTEVPSAKKLQEHFFFHLKPIFVSLFFKRRRPKGDVLLFQLTYSLPPWAHVCGITWWTEYSFHCVPKLIVSQCINYGVQHGIQ